MEGYIKLYRQILKNPIVCKDSDHFSVWIYLLLNATHANYDVLFNGEKITLKPGELITGRKIIAEKLKISESKVQRILKLLENEHQIEQQTSNQNRVISIVNWSSYQSTEHLNEQQVNNEWTTDEQRMNNERTTSEQRVNTNKNINNINNGNNNKKNDNNNGNNVKHKYGEYKNVLLTDEEYHKLVNEFPNDYRDRIEKLSCYIASTGKSYKNFLATIRNWSKMENQRKAPITKEERMLNRVDEVNNWL